jgi:hypothetical protein
MSARDVMAKAILNAGMNMGALAHRRADTFEGKIVDFQIEALTAAGFSIVHKDEIHAPSVERAIGVAVETYGSAKDWDYFGSAHVAIAAALRELMKEVG